jgi:hypothetical protein
MVVLGYDEAFPCDYEEHCVRRISLLNHLFLWLTKERAQHLDDELDEFV